MKDRLIILFAVLGLLTCGQNTFAQQNAERHVLRKEAPFAALARPVGKPAATESLRVAISLPLRNHEALDGLLKRLYDPASPDYRRYLTPDQFTANFGPTEEDYQRVINFAKSFGLSIEQTHDSRLLLDVRGSVADFERAFHVSLRTYQHPTEAREFRAPETEPWVDPKLPIQEVTGLSDYVLLRPTAHWKPIKTHGGAAGGSSPITGDYIGQDFRNAYAPGVSLTGAGQQVGLFEADGYYAADIENYEAYAGQSTVTLQNVLVDGFNGVPGALNPEVAADIEMAIAMAPGLSSVVIFECTNTVSGNSGGTEVQYWLDTLDRMAASNQVKQFSSSWGYVTADPTQDPNTAFDAAFQQMAAQGQSFFQASGDGDAWATPIWVPADSPYVTSVGGTMLSMNGLGASFASETVWNSGYGPPGWPITDNNYWGSGGGVSTVYPIPYWQTNVSMTANLGSTTSRNIPDVALTATNIFITADNGEYGGYFGTSCSAPLWAGFNALINQQAANSNKPPVGFINPAIYALGEGPNYSLCFHDTTTGSNTYAGSLSKYYATSGFDLCTGWGTPAGSNLINALAGVYQPTITTQPGSQTDGVGGSATFTVAATGVTPLSYQWQFGGANIASATQSSFSLANLDEANGGNFTVVVTNQWGSVTSSVAVLTVSSGTPVVTWANPASITYGTALGGAQLNASANVSGTFAYTPASGTILNAGNNTLSVVFTPTDTVDYSKATNTVSLVVSPAPLTLTANSKSKTYGQTVTFAGTEFTTSGLVNGNTVTSVTLTSSGAAATAAVASSPYSIAPSAAVGGGLANYNITYVNGSLTVGKAALSVTASAESKSYGQTVTFGSGSALFTSSGLQNGETIGSVTLGVSGSGGAATASVSGSPYTITPSAATGGTFSSGNYTITYHTANLTVGRAALSVTASAENKSYGQTVTFGSGSALFTSSGLQNSETIGSVTLAVSGNGGVATATVAGSPYTITASAATGGTFTANNYTITYHTGSLTVGAATLSITASAESKTYGQTVTFGSGSALFTSSGLQNGETIGTVTLGVAGSGGLATAPVSGSPYSITPSAATGGTFVAGNYSITYNAGSLTVNGAALTVTANAQSKLYGQTAATGSGSAQFTSSALQNGETIGSVTLSVNNSGGAATAPVSGSPYTITPSAATGGTFTANNYTITYNAGSLTVSPVGLTITASAESKAYGQTLAFGAGSGLFASSGLQNGETIGSVTLEVSGTGGAATALVSGSPYTITPSAATGGTFTPGNYLITYAQGALTVSGAALTITASAQTKIYGQTVNFGGGSALFSASGLQNGETISSVTLAVNNNGGTATAPVSGSAYAISPSAATGGTFSAGNYAITYANGALTVNPAALTITANNRTKTYGQTVTFVGTEFAANGLLNGDAVTSATLNCSGSPATASVAGSPYSIVASAAVGTGLGNYIISYASGTLTVNAAGLTVTANNRSKTYGQTVTFAGTEFTTSGLLNSDTVSSVTLSSSGTAATASVAGSAYAITPGAAVGTGLGNYTISYASGTLTVNAAGLTVTANNRSKTYGQTVTFAGTEFASAGLLNSDTVSSVTLSSSGAAATASIAGSPYAIVPNTAIGTGLNNYTITYGNGTLTVSPASLTITANSRSKTYGQTVTFAGTEFTTSGLLNSDTVSSVTLSSSGATATASMAGSPYAIVPTAAIGTGLNNYTIGYSSGTLTVNPASLTITANNRSKTYGQTVTFAGTEFTTSGLLNSDTVSSVTLSSSGTVAAASVAGSPYAIVASAAVGTGLNNYTIGYSSGALTVTPATLTITANNRTKTYGQTVTFAGTEFASAGLLNSDTVSSVTLSSSGASATASVAGSPYAIVASAAVGTGLNNYTIGYSSGTLTVNPASLTITANNRTKTYGQTVTFAGTEFASAGLLNSDTVTSVTLSSSGAAASASVAGSPYAIVPSGAVGTGLGNYSIGYVDGTLTVSGSGVTVTWNNPASITYGAALSSSQLNATANVAGTFVYTPTNNSVLNSGINTLSVVFTPADTVDYSSVTDMVNLAVTLAPLTVTAASYSRPFNTANPVFTGTISGVVNSDNITATYGCSATVTTPLGGYAITPALADPNNRQTNYTVNLVNGTLSIVQATPGVTWTNPPPIVYGTALGASQLNALPNVPGTFVYNPPAGSVLNSGSNSLSAVFTPTDAVDYSSVTNTAGLIVGLAPLTVTADSFNRAFDTANPVFTGTISGLVNSDNITAAYNCTATTGSSVGTYPIAPSLVDPGNRQTNYSVNLVNGILVVGHPSQTFSWNTPAPITYGAPLSSVQLSASVNVIGTYVYSPTNGTVLNTGTNILTVVFTPIDMVDYTGVTNSVSLVVLPAPLTITGATTNRQYGQANPALMGTINGITNGDDITDTFSCSATVGSPVGNYAIAPGLASGTDLTNYTITYVNGTLAVKPASLSISANNRVKTYGQSVSFAGTEFAASGLLNSDSVTAVSLTSGGTAATASVAGSPYAIIPSGAVGSGLANYTIAYTNGSLTVSPAALTITANNQGKTYGQTVTFGSGSLLFTSSALQNGETIGSVTLSVNNNGGAATAPVSGSPYTISPGAATGGTFNAGNYAITYANGTLTVNPAALTITANNQGKTYGQTVTFGSGSLLFTSSALQNGETIGSVTLSVNNNGGAATAPVSGSPYAISPSAATGGTFSAGNYAITYANGALSVNPAALTITANNRSKTYGQTVTFAGTEFAANGLLNGDAVTSATLNCSGSPATASVAGSPYSIVASAAVGTGLGNYTISYVNGVLTINPASLTVTANNRSKTYGQTVTFAGTEFTSAGLLNSDTVSGVTLNSSGAVATAAVAGSPYTIVPGAAVGTGLGNYTISYVSGALMINPASLTITANNRSKTYGQTVTFAGTEFTTIGLLNGDTVSSVTLSSSGAAATASGAGSAYAITPGAAVGTGLGNYTITYGNGALTVNPASLTVTAKNRSKTYGQTVTFAGTEFTSAGLLNSDTVSSVTLSSSGATATASVAGSAYAIAPSAAVGTGLGNYTITYDSGALTVNPAALTITANSRTKTYGQTVTFAGTEFASAGLLNSDTVSGVTLSSSGAAATASVAGSPYTIVPSGAVGTGLNNYTITYGAGILTVNPASLTITANNRSKTYGQTVTFAGTEFTTSDLLNGDTVSSVTLSSSGAAASASVAGSPYAIVPSVAVGTGLGNYSIGYINGTLTVSGSAVTVTWGNPPSIVYGAALSSSQLNATANVAGTFVYTPTNNSILNSGINALSVVFTPTDTVDYSSVTDTVNLAVTLAPLTVTAASYSRPFNTANPVFTGTINGVVNSDNITATYSCSATPASSVGTYPVVPSLVDPNNRRTNYAVNLVNGILVIGHPPEVNTWTNPAPIIYGTPLSSVQLNESVNVVGTYAYLPGAGTVLNTGTNTLSVVFTPADTVDYTIVTASVSVVVLPAPLTITAANATRPYGQANPVFVGIMSGVTNGDIISDTYSCGATSASPVGTYTIAPGLAAGSDLTNYTISYANGTLTVTPAALTVTANSRTKTYGQSASFAGTEFTASGLLNGDSVSQVNLTSSGASPTATVAGSPYAIVPGAATGSGLGNYSITYAPGTLTVAPAGLTITANNQTKTFGQTLNFAGTEFTASGLFNGDSVSGVSLVSAGSAATASVAGSPYTIMPGAAVGTGLNNYTIAYVGGKLVVLEASPIVTWADPNPIVYGTDLDTNELNATASVPGNFAYTPTNGTFLNSGSNVLSVVFTPSDPVDYATITATVILTVLPAPLTVTADSFSRSFEADNPVFTGTISGLTNGDVISASYSCAADFSSPVGTYPIVPSLIDPGDRETNYTVNLVDGILVVGHPAQAFNWSNPAPIVYGTPLSFVQLDASVNVLGTYAYSPTNGTVLNTGTNTLSVIFTPSDTFDYTSVTDTVALVVLPAPLSITGPTESRQYGQANPVLTGTITGVTNGDDITVGFSSSANTASPVGTYAIVPGLATGSDLTNYTISYANGALTVTPAALNITANNRTKVYGQGLIFVGNEFAANGLVNGDSVSSVTLSSSGAAANSPVAGSPYVITPGAAIGSGLANYTITYANGSLVVSLAALTITADSESKLLGQTFSFSGAEFTANGLVNGDTVTSVTLTSLGAPATATVAGSPYAIVPSAAEGAGLANYAISYVNGVLTVTSASQPVIQSATRSGDSIVFAWGAAAAQSYQIQFTTNLSQGQWADLGGPVTATNSSAAASVSITNSQTFYRLLLLP